MTLTSFIYSSETQTARLLTSLEISQIVPSKNVLFSSNTIFIQSCKTLFLFLIYILHISSNPDIASPWLQNMMWFLGRKHDVLLSVVNQNDTTKLWANVCRRGQVVLPSTAEVPDNLVSFIKMTAAQRQGEKSWEKLTLNPSLAISAFNHMGVCLALRPHHTVSPVTVGKERDS